MPPSYNHPRSEPRARRFRTSTTGRILIPSPGASGRALRLAHTWPGPFPAIDSTPTDNPFYIPPGDTEPSTPVSADIEAFKRSFPKLSTLTNGGPSSARRYTPTPLARRHAVIIRGRPLGAKRQLDGNQDIPLRRRADHDNCATSSNQPIQSSPISIKIESSPTYYEMLLKGTLSVGRHSPPNHVASSNQPGPSRPPAPSPRKDTVTSEARALVIGVGLNPIDELVLQWAQEALEEEGRPNEEDLHHLPKFSRARTPRKQTRYSLRNRAKVGKPTVVTMRTEEDFVALRPAFFRKAAIKTFNPARLPVANIDLFTELCSRNPRGLTSVQFSKLFLQCQDCGYYHYSERLELHKCSAQPVETTKYSSIEYDIGFDFLSYKRRGLSEEQMRGVFITCSLCERVFLKKYNRSHVCDSDQ